MNQHLEQTKTRTRALRLEDSADSRRESAAYSRHFNFFEIDPKEKTIVEIIKELDSRIEDRFNCKKIIFGPAYGFSEFRFTPEYTTYRELSLHLARLSCWLYKDREFPRELRKMINEGAKKIYE